MIKNIIFDIGNVLLTFNPEEFISKYTIDTLKVKTFMINIIHSKTWLEMDRGLISVNSAEIIFLRDYPALKDLLELFFENWLDIFLPIEKNIEIMKNLKQKGYKIYALSNFIKETYEFVINKFDFFSFFDGSIISWKEKKIKPEIGIYKTLLNRYNLLAPECVFLDDYLKFIAPAERLGMHTIYVEPLTDLRQELRKLNINI
ncbi:MAG: HAD family phosphatase, partial [Promethearchaeota archaeon]